MTLAWIQAEPPLAARGALASGEPARALALRLLERTHVCPALAGPGALIALDPELPWVDGVTWIGPCPDAPELWLPTLSRPSLPPALVLRALRLAGHTGPLLLTPAGVYPLGAVGDLDPERLRAWLEA
jgi:hypothetical protein